MMEAYPRYSRTPMTDAIFIFKIIEVYINKGLCSEHDLSPALADMLDIINHSKPIDCSVLDLLINQYGDIDKGYKPSEKGAFSLPIYYTAQALKAYMVKSEDNINLAWSFISDAKYWLGFATEALIHSVHHNRIVENFSQLTDFMIEDSIKTYAKFDTELDKAKEAFIDNELVTTKVLNDSFDVQIKTTDMLINHHDTLTESINRARAFVRNRASRGGKAKYQKSGAEDKKNNIRSIWATGKYSTRDICAEEEYNALGFISFGEARKALKNTPKPE
jgi:hypothetical protein